MSEENFQIKKSVIYTFGTLILILVAGFFLFNTESSVTGNVVNENSNGDFQEIVLGVKNLNYSPNTITVKEGIPVRIYLDKTVTGCLRSFTIKDFGVAKYLKTPDEYIEFTPNKKGTFRFACSMGMGTGTLIVE